VGLAFSIALALHRCDTMACMLKVSLILVVLAALSVPSGGAKMHANPIRRVITMLQMMMKKSEDQSALEEELFDQFMCACKKKHG